MRLVLDTNVVISGVLWQGSPSRLMRLSRTNDVALFTSPPLLSELTVTLSRRKFEWKVTSMLLTVAEILDSYTELTTSVRPAPVPRLAPDPDDDVVIGTAVTAEADFIVTGDQALISVYQYNEIQIISPAQALKMLAPI